MMMMMMMFNQMRMKIISSLISSMKNQELRQDHLIELGPMFQGLFLKLKCLQKLEHNILNFIVVVVAAYYNIFYLIIRI